MTPAQWNEEFAGLVDRLVTFGSLDPMERRQAERVLREYRGWRVAVQREADDARMWEQEAIRG